jgi:hypothetical protein
MGLSMLRCTDDRLALKCLSSIPGFLQEIRGEMTRKKEEDITHVNKNQSSNMGPRKPKLTCIPKCPSQCQQHKLPHFKGFRKSMATSRAITEGKARRNKVHEAIIDKNL